MRSLLSEWISVRGGGRSVVVGEVMVVEEEHRLADGSDVRKL